MRLLVGIERLTDTFGTKLSAVVSCHAETYRMQTGQNMALHGCASAIIAIQLTERCIIEYLRCPELSSVDAYLRVVACSGDGFENVMGYRQLIGYDMEASLHNCAASCRHLFS